MSNLTNISPIDGRYKNKVEELEQFFSEFALIEFRVFVEIQYLIALWEIGLKELSGLSDHDVESISLIHSTFNINEAENIKEIEKSTNHDVKAVEYYIKNKMKSLGLSKFIEFVHFGLTSQDINNTAFPMMLRDALNESMIPQIVALIAKLRGMSLEWRDVPMLARTHGQPASPTTLGKELFVFVERLEQQLLSLNNIELKVKFGGATGNFNAHIAAYPEIDWIKFANNFTSEYLDMPRSQYTTQIDHYDSMAEVFDALARINTILIDFTRDIWAYISMDYFKLKVVAKEVGSSAMPHKVNPIDFENAEGNLAISNSLFRFLAEKLPISRLQRDLTDSTVVRNIGVPLAHMLIALKSISKGLAKLELNISALEIDLEDNWAVVSEAIQTILRKIAYPEPYEALKQLTRGKAQIDRASIHEFIDTLNIDNKLKYELKSISPFNYTGYRI
jgi:adenylosuccinate lyase